MSHAICRSLLRGFLITALMVASILVNGCGSASRPATEEEIRKYEEESRKAVQQEGELQRQTQEP